jgi:hypothetical protein
VCWSTTPTSTGADRVHGPCGITYEELEFVLPSANWDIDQPVGAVPMSLLTKRIEKFLKMIFAF